jgi:GntR family transcriptional regulator
MSEPMYRQIAADLGSRIESGELPPGQEMPSGVEIREDYARDGKEISRYTFRDEIKLLVARGLVETRPGQGIFVLGTMQPFVTTLNTDPEPGGGVETVYRSEVERQGRGPEVTVPRVEVQRPSDLVAVQLQLDADSQQVISRHQERRIDGIPWSLQTTFYPMDFATRGAAELLMAKDFPEGIVRTLEGSLGIKQVGWRDMITVRPPSGDERAFFGLSDKVQVSVFEVRRTSYDEDGKPIRFTVTVYPADRNQFEMEGGCVPST